MARDHWLSAMGQMTPPMSFEASIATIGKGIPIGRMGTAQAYTNLACFLASDAGSSVTGTAMHLDSGACPVVCGETGGGRRDAARLVPMCRRQC